MPNLPCFHFNLIQLKQSRWSWDKKTIANVTQFHFQSNFISDGTDPLLYGALFILSIYFRWPPLEDNTTNCYDVHFQPWHNPFFFSSLHPKTPPINPPPPSKWENQNDDTKSKQYVTCGGVTHERRVSFFLRSRSAFFSPCFISFGLMSNDCVCFAYFFLFFFLFIIFLSFYSSSSLTSTTFRYFYFIYYFFF